MPHLLQWLNGIYFHFTIFATNLFSQVSPPGVAPMSSASKPLKRSLDVMDLMTASPKGCSIKEISESMGLPMPTAYRLVVNLADAGYLEGSGRHALYRLGQRY